jgi:eukaryotic-like serine/threonine-protein kinase
MATAGLNRMMLWGDLEGRDLEGRWLLGRLARPLGRTAWFEAMGADGMPLMLSITEALNDEDQLLARLQEAAEIHHPHVVAIREAAISHLDDTPVVVAAMEITEENLADVLRERTLSAPEGRQVLDATLAALTVIHAQGLVHQHMEAASILAMGETIKLRSDCLQIGGSKFGTSAADDVRSAARMVTQAVTGFSPKGENDPVLQLLPEPMARAVRRALTGNSSATEVAALAGTRLELLRDIARDLTRIEPLSKRVLKAATASDVAAVREKNQAEQPVERESTRPKRAGRKSLSRETAAPRMLAMKPSDVQEQAALFAELSVLPDERQRNDLAWAMKGEAAAEAQWGSAPYLIAAVIAVLLVTVLTVYGMMHLESPGKRSAAPPARSPAVVVAQPTASLVRSAAVNAVASAKGEEWRVVAYTFEFEAEAERTAKEVARRYPELDPRVFALKGAAPWMVTLGGTMSRAEALVLREKAVSLGLPDDTYAQKFR